MYRTEYSVLRRAITATIARKIALSGSIRSERLDPSWGNDRIVCSPEATVHAPTTASPVYTEEAQTKAKLTQPQSFRLRAKSRLTSDPAIRITMLVSTLRIAFVILFPHQLHQGHAHEGGCHTTDHQDDQSGVHGQRRIGWDLGHCQRCTQENFLCDIKHPAEGDQSLAKNENDDERSNGSGKSHGAGEDHELAPETAQRRNSGDT